MNNTMMLKFFYSKYIAIQHKSFYCKYQILHYSYVIYGQVSGIG